MDFVETFKDSLVYPTKNIKILFILIGLALIPGIFALILGMGAALFQDVGLILIVGIICFIVALIVGICIIGYGLNVVKSTVNLEDVLPELDLVASFLFGLKYIVLGLVFGVIISIIGGILSFIMLSLMYVSPALGIIIGIIAFVILILIYIFFLISFCRLAATENIGDALNFGEVWNDIQEINLLNIIIWGILLAIIVGVISLIVAIISGILGLIHPFITLIIAPLLGILLIPYISLFGLRATGLLYLSKED